MSETNVPNPSPDGDFSKHKLNEPNATKRLISISAGARLLGYSSTPPIKKLIDSGKLPSYTLPDSKRKMIDQNELESLIQPYVPENKEKLS